MPVGKLILCAGDDENHFYFEDKSGLQLDE